MTDLMDTLRRETRSQHERLHHVVNLPAMLQSMQQYAVALNAYADAVLPIEKALMASLDVVPSGLSWDERLVKSDWIIQDLGQLDRLPIHKGAIAAADWIDTLPAFVGAAYVMEGMTLGASRIAPMVFESLAINKQNGGRFFHAYGEDTSRMWNAFRDWVGVAGPATDLAVASARQSFELFELALSDWYAGAPGLQVFD